jgi:hypothetical protein
LAYLLKEYKKNIYNKQMDQFEFEDMITCFMIAGREDLIEQLEVIISQVKELYDEDNEISSDEDYSEESIEVESDKDGFMFLK